jgi:hypothetical protein
LHDQIAGEAVGRFYDDPLDPIARDAPEHFSKAVPRVDCISTTHGRVVVLANELISGTVGERFNRYALPHCGTACRQPTMKPR